MLSVFSFVGRFMTRRERMDMMGDRAKKFTNVYVKNFGDALDEDKLRDVFTACGPIVSCKVLKIETFLHVIRFFYIQY